MESPETLTAKSKEFPPAEEGRVHRNDFFKLFVGDERLASGNLTEDRDAAGGSGKPYSACFTRNELDEALSLKSSQELISRVFGGELARFGNFSEGRGIAVFEDVGLDEIEGRFFGFTQPGHVRPPVDFCPPV